MLLLASCDENNKCFVDVEEAKLNSNVKPHDNGSRQYSQGLPMDSLTAHSRRTHAPHRPLQTRM